LVPTSEHALAAYLRSAGLVTSNRRRLTLRA
jgi:hypothetical protein